MKHAASRSELYAYWQEKRGSRPAPERTEIEPGAIRGVLADAFILSLDRSARHPIRLAGTRMCALFGHEIKGESFLDLWAPTNRATMEGLLSILSDECTGTVAGAIGLAPSHGGIFSGASGHDRRAAPCRRGDREAAHPALHGAAWAARVPGLQWRRRRSSPARRGRPDRRVARLRGHGG
jgi:hypothetical protein